MARRADDRRDACLFLEISFSEMFKKQPGMLVVCVLVILDAFLTECMGADLKLFHSCNTKIYMEDLRIHQAALSLTIPPHVSSNTRVSCDFTINAGAGKHVMFYFTEVYLGSPNTTRRLDKACMEPRDVSGYYESVPKDMRAIICTAAQLDTSHVYATSGSALNIRFYRNRGFNINAHFKLKFTAFRVGSCRTSERKCGNDRCIAHEIVCNDHNPCGDHSDCPTGLEHLSSWAMSGIVILALLAGGIVIIMAAVCIQRNGNKRDLDDLSNLGGGTNPGGTTVEMIDVKDANTANGNKPNPNNGGAPQRQTSEEHTYQHVSETAPLFQEEKQSIGADSPYTSDKQKLLGPKSGDTCSIGFVPRTVDDASLTLFASSQESGNTPETMTTNISSYDLFDQEIGSADPNLFPHPGNASFLHSNGTLDTFGFHGSCVLTDSDSGTEAGTSPAAGTSPVHDITRDNMVQKVLRVSPPRLPQNGSLAQGKNTMFCDYKPPPPKYGYMTNSRNNKIVITPTELRAQIGD